MATLENKLRDRLLEAASIAKTQYGYPPTLFIKMITELGGVETCKQLVNDKRSSSGFDRLYEIGKLDLTAEAIILEPAWRTLFSDTDVENAKKRLKAYGYIVKPSPPNIEDEVEENSSWSRQELTAAVDAYLFMLGKEKAGLEYVKAEINRELRSGTLSKRSKSSIEFRMQNISAVMDGLCLERIAGYLPAKNIGKNVFEEIKSILSEKGTINLSLYEPTDDNQEYEKRSQALLKALKGGRPRGNVEPEKSEKVVGQFKRDPLVRAWVLNRANGFCEKCGNPGPFRKPNGEAYLEIHHLVMLSENGEDTIENTVALCPNCHRELHYAENRIELKLYVELKVKN